MTTLLAFTYGEINDVQYNQRLVCPALAKEHPSLRYRTHPEIGQITDNLLIHDSVECGAAASRSVHDPARAGFLLLPCVASDADYATALHSRTTKPRQRVMNDKHYLDPTSIHQFLMQSFAIYLLYYLDTHYLLSLDASRCAQLP